jgi:hypothetical protein
MNARQSVSQRVISECKIDVNMIAGTHGNGGGGPLKGLSALGAE